MNISRPWATRGREIGKKGLRAILGLGLPSKRLGYKRRMHKVCEVCQFGKQARKPFPRHVQESKKPLELIHSDVWTTKAASIGGYFVTFIDDYSRKVWVYFMKRKVKCLGISKLLKLWLKKKQACK